MQQKGKHFFLIDNDETTNFYNEGLLSDHIENINLIVHNDCDDGLLFLEKSVQNKTVPCIWLVDLNMPKMNGFEFIQNTFNNFNCIPSVYMFSSLDKKTDVLKSEKNSHIMGYINKPLKEADIKFFLSA